MPLSREDKDKYIIAGKVAAEALKLGTDLINEGVSYLDVAERVEDYIQKKGCGVAFPTNIAVNDIAAHYTPTYEDTNIFKKGDIVKLDVGAHYDGFIADTAMSIEVTTENNRELILSVRDVHNTIREIITADVMIGRIGEIIENTVNQHGYIVIENLTGHNLRKYTLHGGLTLPNVAGGNYGRLKVGDVVAIEPFATLPEKGLFSRRITRSSVVDFRGMGTIYRLISSGRIPKSNAARNLLEIIKDRWPYLPLCERWIRNYVDTNIDTVGILAKPDVLEQAIDELIKRRILYRYFVLRERRGKLVSQWEHTYIVEENGCTVITRP